MSLRNTDVRTPGAKSIAQKWNLPLTKVYALISQGAKVESEHNRDKEKAKQVARDHINERPDYYKRLKHMERLPIRMREGLSTEPERDSETIGDYTGSSRKVMKVDEIKLPKVPPKAKKAIAVGMTAANIATGADIYDRASRGVGSPIRDVAAAASGLPGKIGYGAMAANWTAKGFDKAKEHLRAKKAKMEEQGSPANPARYTERPMYEAARVRFIKKMNPADLPPRPDNYKPGDFAKEVLARGPLKYPGKKKKSQHIKEESHADKKYGFKHPETGKLIGRIVPSYGKFTTRRVKLGMTASVRKTHKSREDAEQHLIKHADSSKQVNEISAELVGKVSNARFWQGKAPSKTLSHAINKKFIESGKKKEDKKTQKEETTMDTKNLINEALDDILDNNLVSMKENLMTALQEKAMEKIEEKKKDIAANYFAQ